MAKRKIELFIDINNEKEFYHTLNHNADRLICAEIYNTCFGSCTALDRLFLKIKLDWSDGKILLIKVPCDDIEDLARFRNRSEPVYMFIVSFLNYIKLEKKREELAVTSRRAARQAARKRHRAELMVPHLRAYNFVLFWPHATHAHPELYEKWDENNIVMVGREELELTLDNAEDVLYAGDAPRNEAAMHQLTSGRSLAICFRLLDTDKHFVSLVRKILYEDLMDLDETNEIAPRKPAFEHYKSYSLSKEQILQKRREEKQREKEAEKEKRARRMSEIMRLARQAKQEAIEAKQQEKERLKLELLKAGNLEALEKLKQEKVDDDEELDFPVPEELPEEVDEEVSEEEDEDAYFPPAGQIVPGFYAPPNDVAKVNGLAILFPNLVSEHVTPQPEYLPPHVLVMLEVTKRYEAVDAVRKYRSSVIHMGIFTATTPYDAVHIAYTVKQYDTLPTPPDRNDIKIAFMISVKVDLALLELMDLHPAHVSRDSNLGEDECAALFPVDYGDDYQEFEDFGDN